MAVKNPVLSASVKIYLMIHSGGGGGVLLKYSWSKGLICTKLYIPYAASPLHPIPCVLQKHL